MELAFFVDDPWAKLRRDCTEARRALRNNISCDLIGINNGAAQTLEYACNGCFSAGDSTGESYEHGSHHTQTEAASHP